MGKISIGFSQFTTSATPATMAKVIGASGKTFEIVEIAGYGAGLVSPADVQHQIVVGFMTNATAGTPTGTTTPESMSKAAPASANTAGSKYTGTEPTAYVNPMPLFSFNQRGGFRWAVPVNEGYRPDPVANFSFGARVASSGAGSIDGAVQWWE
jgi:hypothetical protein